MQLARGRRVAGMRPLWLAVLTLALCAMGCGPDGPPRGTVSGVVTYKDKPVTEGQVVFSAPERGQGAMANLDSTGKYSIPEGIEVGEYKVMVTPPPSNVAAGGPKPALKVYTNLPEQYRNEATTDLKANVVEGENTFNFDLKL